MRARLSLILSTLVLLNGCGGEGGNGGGIVVNPGPTPTPSPSPSPSPTPAPTPGPKPTLGSVVSEFSFTSDSAEFQAAAADYFVGQEAGVGLSAAPQALPAALTGQSGYAVTANNPSTDVFAYIWKLVGGLAPNTPYQVTVSLRFGTNAPPLCPGGPGENVLIKAGASPRAPASMIQAGKVIVNFDPATSLGTLGNFAQGTVTGTCGSPLYVDKTLSTGATAPTVTSDANGQLWLVIGTDSTFNGTTKIYYLNGIATFSPVLN